MKQPQPYPKLLTSLDLASASPVISCSLLVVTIVSTKKKMIRKSEKANEFPTLNLTLFMLTRLFSKKKMMIKPPIATYIRASNWIRKDD